MTQKPGFVVTLAVAGIVLASPALAQQGSIDIFTERSNDLVSPSGDPFFAGIDIDLMDSFDEVSSVTIDIDHGGSSDQIVLAPEDEGRWTFESNYPSVASLTDLFDGTWTVTIDGVLNGNSADSVSTFTVDTGMIEESDYLPTPSNFSPAHGATGVPPNATVSWTAPTGGSSADVLIVELESLSDFQEALSINGGIQITDESWDPPADMSPEFQEFTVTYLSLLDQTSISTISVDSGSIQWLNPLEEFGGSAIWPDQTPLFSIATSSTVGFDVAIPEPGTALLLIGLGAVGVMRRRRFA